MTSGLRTTSAVTASHWYGVPRGEREFGKAMRVVDAVEDLPDQRDYLYQPTLSALAPEIDPNDSSYDFWHPSRVRAQGKHPSCTGHALAGLIDHFLASDAGHDSTRSRPKGFGQKYASARMLYETARCHDEWLGEDYGGSSCRGVLKGFYYNGVCSIRTEKRLFERRLSEIGGKSAEHSDWFISKELLENAALIQLGAYYRIRPRLSDYHAAINETGGILVSARIHDGWDKPDCGKEIAFRRQASGNRGQHAFLVVGYNADGFWIQNSWDTTWGCDGLALWSYEDWAENVHDAWVLRLAVTQLDSRVGLKRMQRARGRLISENETRFQGRGLGVDEAPSRMDMLGHLVPVRDGRIGELGPYHHNLQTLGETIEVINLRYTQQMQDSKGGEPFADRGSLEPVSHYKYRHVLLHFLGGWADEAKLASAIEPLIPVFKENGIYPLFFQWETELTRQLHEFVRRTIDEVNQTTGLGTNGRDKIRERLIEGRISVFGSRLFREYARSATRTFVHAELGEQAGQYEMQPASGTALLDHMFTTLSKRFRNGGLSYHVVAHDVGAMLVAAYMVNHRHASRKPVISSMNLVSPWLREEPFNRTILEFLSARSEGRVNRRARIDVPVIEQLRLINLDERDVMARAGSGYGKTWQRLWSESLGIDRRRQELSSGTRRGHTRQLFSGLQGDGEVVCLKKSAKAAYKGARNDGLAMDYQVLKPILKSSHWLSPDLRPEVLNQVLKDILGKTPPIHFKPTEGAE